jgi:hypothetical protein
MGERFARVGGKWPINLMERDQLEDLGLDRSLKLKWVMKK